jgi:uncharacterized membrane protein (DUF485 family)
MDGDNRMNPTTLHGIRSNPLFATLVKRRRRYIACLTAITLIPYCGFIVLVGFAPALLAIRFSADSIVNIGWPIGVALIVGSWCLTGLYVRRANGEFDALTAQILAGAKP